MNKKNKVLFVLCSNAIEGIDKTEGPFFTNHLAALETTLIRGEQGESFGAKNLHKTLLAHIKKPWVGKYRTTQVSVAGWICPNHEIVPELTKDWKEAVEYILQTYRGCSKFDREEAVWKLHNWFLCIHPFQDGNGRVARLFMAYAAVRLGLDPAGFIVKPQMKQLYCAMIRSWQNEVFEPHILPKYEVVE